MRLVCDSERNISIFTGLSDTCSVTGEKIKRMEPRATIFLNSGDAIFSRKGIQEIEQEIITKSKTNINFHEFDIFDIDSSCDFCGNDSSYDIKSSKFSRRDKPRSICSDCFQSCIKKVKSSFENLELVYFDDSGFSILGSSSGNNKYYDDIERDFTHDSDVIEIGCSDISNDIIHVSVSNIETLVSILKNPDDYNSVSFISNQKARPICLTCSSFSSEYYQFYSGSICEDCSSSLVKNLESFIQKNKSYIVSRKI